MNADGTGVTRLTSTSGYDEQPDWSPDGSKIAFASYRSGSDFLNIYVMNADGTGQTRLTPTTSDNHIPPGPPMVQRLLLPPVGPQILGIRSTS